MSRKRQGKLSLLAGTVALAGLIVLTIGERNLASSKIEHNAKSESVPKFSLELLEPTAIYDNNAIKWSADSNKINLVQKIRKTVKIKAGDTLMTVLMRNGIARPEAYAVISALTRVHNPRRITPEMRLTLIFNPHNEELFKGLEKVILHANTKEDFIAQKSDGDFVALSIKHKTVEIPLRASGRINDSLYRSAERANVPPKIIVNLIRLYSFDVDFQRDIRAGDKFEVLFIGHYTSEGKLARYGDIEFARLFTRGKYLQLYRFQTIDGKVDYYNERGQSAQKALMKTPIDGARLTSGFGMRKHPILGYRKSHRGIDFGAPMGTPIMAAGNGTIELANWNGSYGKYIRIRHNSTYKTAYGHLSKFARGISNGKRVEQGQIIGYVGSTGRSTGAHLHYEILYNNRAINPLTLKLPSGRKLSKNELIAFQEKRSKTDIKFSQTLSTANIETAHIKSLR